MAGAINVGAIEADLKVNSGHLERGLAAARAALDAIARESKQLNEDFERTGMSSSVLADRLIVLTQTADRLKAAMTNAYASTTQLHTGLEIVNAAASKAGGGAAALGMGLMQVGAIVDDVQYGFMGVVNNIQPLVYSFSTVAGLSTGWATGIAAGAQIAAVAAYQLYVHWNDVLRVLELSPVQTEAERMEELGQKTHKTAEETAEYNKYKKEQLEIERLLNEESKDTKDRAKTIEKDIANAPVGKPGITGGQAVEKGIFETLRAQGRGAKMTPDELAEIEKWEKSEASPFMPTPAPGQMQHSEAVAFEARERIDKEDHNRAKKLMHKALTDPDKLNELIGIVRSNPGAFPPGFLGDLMDALPENRKQQQEWETQGKVNAEKWKRNEHEKKENAQAKKHTEHEFDREVDRMAKEFAKSALGEDAIAGKLTEKQVKKAMEKAGFDKGIIEGYGSDIHKKMIEHAEERVRNNAIQNDIDETSSRQQLLVESERNNRRKALQDAKQAVPGITEITQGMFAGQLLTGRVDRKGTRRRIKEELSRNGVAEDLVESRTEAVMDEARGDFRKKFTGKVAEINAELADEARKKQLNRKVDVFDAASLANRLQASVGADDMQKKQLEAQLKMVQWLEKMANEGALRFQTR